MPLKTLVNEERINTGRQKSFDYIKTLAILFMVTIHWYEEMSVCYSDGTTSVLGYIIEFLGGPLAAPVFMFSMGLGMVYSNHRTPAELFKRGIKLLVFSYVLNLIRLSLSYFIAGKLVGYFDTDTFLFYTFNIDILSFGGMSFIFTALLKKIKVPVWAMPIIAIVMMTIGTFINYDSDTIFGRYVLALFVKSSYLSYFPLFNWYLFPTLGMIYARYNVQIKDQDRWHRITLRFSIAFIIGLISACIYYGVSPINFFTIKDDIYYLQNFISALFCFNSFILFESIVYFILNKIKSDKMDELALYMSNNLNTIYILQWIIIGNTLTIGFESGWLQPFPIWASIPLGIAVTVVSTYLSQFCNKLFKF